MINSESFSKRIAQIMEYYELSASAFAEKINVGRSSISHIISGRNKPSLDFIMKILQAFPAIDLYWLMNGKGNFPPEAEIEPSSSESTGQGTKASPKRSKKVDGPSSVEGFSPSDESRRSIDKVIIFYKDGGFDVFKN